MLHTAARIFIAASRPGEMRSATKSQAIHIWKSPPLQNNRKDWATPIYPKLRTGSKGWPPAGGWCPKFVFCLLVCLLPAKAWSELRSLSHWSTRSLTELRMVQNNAKFIEIGEAPEQIEGGVTRTANRDVLGLGCAGENRVPMPFGVSREFFATGASPFDFGFRNIGRYGRIIRLAGERGVQSGGDAVILHCESYLPSCSVFFCGRIRFNSQPRPLTDYQGIMSQFVGSQHRLQLKRIDYGDSDPRYENPPREGSTWRALFMLIFWFVIDAYACRYFLRRGNSGPFLWSVLCFLLLIAIGTELVKSLLVVLNDCVLITSGDKCSEMIGPREYLTINNYWGTVIDMATVLSTDKKSAVIGALAEGSSIRSIERVTGVHRDTIMRLGVKVGQGCAALLDAKMKNLPCNRLEMDEIWGFVGKKDRNVREGDQAVGSVWTFCAIDAETKLVPAFKCGNRDAATAKAFVQDVADRMAYRVQISTDGLNAYVAAMESAYGEFVDYGQIIKTYGREEVSDNRRYSAPKFVSSEKKIIVGNPDERLISTSYVERLNATTRLHMRRLTRLTLAFSKKRENFEAAVALHFAYYNLVKRHNTLRCTPAMAAGVERNFWTVGNLLEATA